MTTLKEIGEIVATNESCIEFLREKEILRRQPSNCGLCNRVMTQIKWLDTKDGYVWRCPDHKGQKKSIRTGSCLDKSRLSLQQFLILSFLWSHDVTVKMAEEMAGLAEKAVKTWFNFYEDVCVSWIENNPPIIGGAGHVVQIAEVVVRKAMHDKGREVPARWIFGGYDLTTRKGFLVHVADRRAETLLPLIQKHILPGTEIHSDTWEAHRRIPELPVSPPYKHLTVKYTEYFTKPDENTCSNGVENMWGRAKRKIRASNGSSAELVPGHLAAFLWRQANGKTGHNAFQSILRDMATWSKSNKENNP